MSKIDDLIKHAIAELCYINEAPHVINRYIDLLRFSEPDLTAGGQLEFNGFSPDWINKGPWAILDLDTANKLIRKELLSNLINNSSEWQGEERNETGEWYVSWRSKRDLNAISYNGGETYTYESMKDFGIVIYYYSDNIRDRVFTRMEWREE